MRTVQRIFASTSLASECTRDFLWLCPRKSLVDTPGEGEMQILSFLYSAVTHHRSVTLGHNSSEVEFNYPSSLGSPVGSIVTGLSDKCSEMSYKRSQNSCRKGLARFSDNPVMIQLRSSYVKHPVVLHGERLLNNHRLFKQRVRRD